MSNCKISFIVYRLFKNEKKKQDRKASQLFPIQPTRVPMAILTCPIHKL